MDLSFLSDDERSLLSWIQSTRRYSSIAANLGISTRTLSRRVQALNIKLKAKLDERIRKL